MEDEFIPISEGQNYGFAVGYSVYSINNVGWYWMYGSIGMGGLFPFNKVSEDIIALGITSPVDLNVPNSNLLGDCNVIIFICLNIVDKV